MLLRSRAPFMSPPPLSRQFVYSGAPVYLAKSCVDCGPSLTQSDEFLRQGEVRLQGTQAATHLKSSPVWTTTLPGFFVAKIDSGRNFWASRRGLDEGQLWREGGNLIR